ncbi:hypothetical protein ACFX2C_028098 [Malus domestica]
MIHPLRSPTLQTSLVCFHGCPQDEEGRGSNRLVPAPRRVGQSGLGPGKPKGAMTVGELMRIQMGISENRICKMMNVQ